MMDPTAVKPFTPLSLDELFALELPDQEHLVDEILPLGAACLLSGREKSGKGLITLDLCAAVALAEPFLDRAVREGPAIYCAAEEDIRDVRARVDARIGDRRDAPFFILPLDGSTDDRLRLDDPFSMQKLWDMVETVQPVVVVLDTLRELHERREDLSDEMSPLLRPVRQLAHETNTTVIVNHHQNKAGGFRGSTAIRAAFDLEWAFSRTDDDTEQSDAPPRGFLRVEGRHGPRSVINMRLGKGLRWELDQPTMLFREPGARARILADIGDANTSQTAVDIAEGTGIKRKTVQNLLAELVQETPRLVTVQGTGAKNDPRRYGPLAPQLEELRADVAEKIIPPGSLTHRGSFGGKHSYPNGDVGDDRWTR
jgi:hypothetical protein